MAERREKKKEIMEMMSADYRIEEVEEEQKEKTQKKEDKKQGKKNDKKQGKKEEIVGKKEVNVDREEEKTHHKGDDWTVVANKKR